MALHPQESDPSFEGQVGAKLKANGSPTSVQASRCLRPLDANSLLPSRENAESVSGRTASDAEPSIRNQRTRMSKERAGTTIRSCHSSSLINEQRSVNFIFFMFFLMSHFTTNMPKNCLKHPNNTIRRADKCSNLPPT